MKGSFFWKGVLQSGLIMEMKIQKMLKGLERMEVLITSHMKVFLGNIYNSYIHTARNAKVTSTRNVCEKTVTKRKKGFQRTIFSIWKSLPVLQKAACIKIVAHAIYTYLFFFLKHTFLVCCNIKTCCDCCFP